MSGSIRMKSTQRGQRRISGNTHRSNTSDITLTHPTPVPLSPSMSRSKVGKSGPDDKGHIRSNSHTSLRLHQAPRESTTSTKTDQPVVEGKKKRTRTRLSPTERVYEDPEVAKEAFRSERDGNPFHRRAPTPYTSRSRRRAVGSGSETETGGEGTSGHEESDSDITRRTIERRASSRSVRSKVSFESRTLRRNGRIPGSGGSSGDDEEDHLYHIRPGQMKLGAWDPGFGASRGIGPVGEAIEVIGLGRKQPRHRIFGREMLKPAIRSGMSSRVTLPGLEHSGSGGRGGEEVGGRRDKPLPVRPGSIVSSVIDVLRSRPSLPPENVLRHRQERIPPTSFRSLQAGFEDSLSPTSTNSLESPNPAHRSNTQRSRDTQQSPTESPHLQSRTFHASPSDWSPHQPSISIQPPPPPPRTSLRSIWTSFSRNLHIDDPPFGHLRSRPRSPILLLPPAENLFAYLATVYLAEWRDWPSAGGEVDRGLVGSLSGKRQGGMVWEWFRRMEVAEGCRGIRVLSSWVGGDKFWGKRILDCESKYSCSD